MFLNVKCVEVDHIHPYLVEALLMYHIMRISRFGDGFWRQVGKAVGEKDPRAQKIYIWR